MRVLFLSRKSLFSAPGGDTTQILKTAEYLENLGLKIDISTELEPNLKDYDIVHVFNLMRGQEAYIQVLNAKKQGKPVSLSTIYGLYTEYEKKASGGIRQKLANLLSPYQMEYLKILARAIRNRELHKGSIQILLKGYYKVLKETCNMVDVFFPNSESEIQRVINDFQLSNIKYIIVPNAVDLKIFDYHNVKVEKEIEEKFKDCILCVARIEGRKSQLNLVKAIKDLPYKLVLIGKPAPNHMKYYERVRKEAGNNVIFLGQINHEKLAQYYKVAKVHALISWMETPGLSSLEAAAMKCNLVITKKGDTYDYFKDYAFYCEPDNVESIKKSIINAYNSPFNEELFELVRKKYTWENTAKETLKGYELAIKLHKEKLKEN
ncbi:MAG TPA: glycosyltransferase [Persephonella sp.]|nr:glycosyltransferase [Hydrogenothermaceae bacterium]HIQ25627.1 glycosyltransferase [Persephonella sp.]